MAAGVPEKHLAIADEVKRIAEERGATPAQVALNWTRQEDGVIIPIIGARTAAQLEDNLGCLEFELGAEELQRLDEASRIEYGFPHEFLSKDNIREVIYGETFPLIDNHRDLE
jgi:aryl-alcohol dehydrogenase-like predicted oxidoreductase